MKRVLITGAGSYIGTKVQQWLEQWPEEFKVDAVDTINDNWKKADFSQYDVVYNVAGIAHVKAAKGEGPLYYAQKGTNHVKQTLKKTVYHYSKVKY